MDKNLLDQSIQKLRGQFLGDADLLDQLDPLLRVFNGLFPSSKSRPETRIIAALFNA